MKLVTPFFPFLEQPNQMVAQKMHWCLYKEPSNDFLF